MEKIKGRWEATGDTYKDIYGNEDRVVRCTNCGFLWGKATEAANCFKHCPGCGVDMVKMDGKENENG